MSEPFEEDGYVWEPGSDERAVAHLRFDPDHGTDLTLINAPWALEVGKPWDVLYGESLWGQPWSLFDVRCRSSQRAANSRSGVRGGDVRHRRPRRQGGRHRVHRPGIWLLRHARVADART